MSRRTGMPTIYKLAKELCRLLTKYQHVIFFLFPEEGNLHIALDNAIQACQLLQTEIGDLLEQGV